MAGVILFKESMPRKKDHGHVTETVNGIQLPGQEPIVFHKRFTSRPMSNRLREIGKGRKTEVLTMRQEEAERLGTSVLIIFAKQVMTSTVERLWTM